MKTSYFILKTLIVILQIWIVTTSDYIIEVTPECAASVGSSQTSTITVLTDIPQTEPFAICKDDYDFVFDQQPDDTYKLTVYFEGDTTLVCVWNKLQDVETYTVDVYVPESPGIFTFDVAPTKIVCNYAGSGTGDTDTSSVGESLKPIQEIQNHMATVSDSSVDLCVADVLENCLTGRIALGKTVLLKAVLIGNIPDEPSFQALSCKAIGGSSDYPVLVGGCGDGVVIPRDQGFITTGKVAKSPYFRAFRVPGSRELLFDCTFIVCTSPCDGSSCDIETRRKKRHAIQQIEATLNQTNRVKSMKKQTGGTASVVEEVIEETNLNTDVSRPIKGHNSDSFPVNTKPKSDQGNKRKIISLDQPTLKDIKTENQPTNIKEISGLQFGIKFELIFLVLFACLVGIGIVIFAAYVIWNFKMYLRSSKKGGKNEKMADPVEKKSLLDNKA